MKRDRMPLVLGATLAAVIAGGPLVPQWALFILTIAFAQGLVALGLMLLLRAGLVSFGQALYYCIGAYTAGGLAHAFKVGDVFLQMIAGAATMGIPEQPVAAQLSLAAAASALQALQRLAPLEKARLVKGLFAAVTADGTIRVGEAELMRLVGAVLDCPLPPMIDEIDPAALAA